MPHRDRQEPTPRERAGNRADDDMQYWLERYRLGADASGDLEIVPLPSLGRRQSDPDGTAASARPASSRSNMAFGQSRTGVAPQAPIGSGCHIGLPGDRSRIC